MDIYQTRDYSQFKISKRNRAVVGQQIVKSIREKNLLPEKPILVTSDMFVLDGQHRLWAAEQLNLPIFYQIARKEVGVEDLARLNIQRTWGQFDYLNFYVHGNINYEFLNEMIHKYKCELYITFMIYCFGTGSRARVDFRSGKFRLREKPEELEERLKKVVELKDLILKEFRDRKLITANVLFALWKLVQCDFYNHEKFLNKISQNYYRENLYSALQWRRIPSIFDGLKAVFLKKEPKNLKEKYA